MWIEGVYCLQILLVFLFSSFRLGNYCGYHFCLAGTGQGSLLHTCFGRVLVDIRAGLGVHARLRIMIDEDP